jgi:hypothetical protein
MLSQGSIFSLSEISSDKNSKQKFELFKNIGRAITQAIRRRLPTAATWIRAQVRSGHVGFMMDKVALGHVFSKYLDFPCQFSFHRLLHIHDYRLSSGAGKIGQTATDLPSGLRLTTPQETKKNSHRLPTAAVRVRLQVKSCGICGGQRGPR